MKKKIIIIGAGISGLSAGCYSQKYGFESEIFEMGAKSGGQCTSWNRKGYMVDGCIEWLVGTNSDNFMYDFWKEIGALEGREFLYHDYLMKLQDEKGKSLTLYSNIDKLEEELLRIATEDAIIIKEFTDAVRNSAFFSKTAPMKINPKFQTMSMEDFLKQLKSPLLKEALSLGLLPMKASEYPVGGLIFRLSFYNRKDAAWPIGGSYEFIKGIEKKYLSSGGKITHNAKVEEVLTNRGTAIGVRLSDGSVHHADEVISTMDAHSTIFQLLKGKYIDEEIMGIVNSNKTLFTSMQISLCCNCDLSSEPHALARRLKKPLIIGDKINTHVCFKNLTNNSELSHSRKSVITTLIATDYEFWENLSKNHDKYKSEKERIAMQIIEAIEESFPKVKGKIEEVDVATPLTYKNYTGVWKGAYMGGLKFPKTLPSLKNFHLAGQWTEEFGSLPAAMMSGKQCIENLWNSLELVCKALK